MPSWHYRGETQRQRLSRDGLRHRLGVPTHLASSVGEALRPGPIDTDTADDLADMLEMHDEHMSVVWPAGMTAGKARTLLAEHRASPSNVPCGGRSAMLLPPHGTADAISTTMSSTPTNNIPGINMHGDIWPEYENMEAAVPGLTGVTRSAMLLVAPALARPYQDGTPSETAQNTVLTGEFLPGLHGPEENFSGKHM